VLLEWSYYVPMFFPKHNWFIWSLDQVSCRNCLQPASVLCNGSAIWNVDNGSLLFGNPPSRYLQFRTLMPYVYTPHILFNLTYTQHALLKCTPISDLEAARKWKVILERTGSVNGASIVKEAKPCNLEYIKKHIICMNGCTLVSAYYLNFIQ